MSEVGPTYDDEIDLFEFFKTLWDCKWLISAFVAIAVLLGSGFLFSKEPVYESKLIYSVDTIPPFYGVKKASTDFQRKFYSVSVFDDWKKSNENVSLVFSDFSDIEVVDGFVLSKDEDERLATLGPEKKGNSFILVKSKKLSILDDFFKYAHHINEVLKDEYIVRSSDELKIIETRFTDLASVDGNIVESVLSIDRYVVSAEKGANVFAIQRPTMPEKVSPKSSLILLVSAFLGGIVGVSFTLVRNAIKKRNGQLAKA